ncbi:putative carboxylesterase 2 [Dichanthelium oligosanthes]|uniref:Putative carboxylesterase 2 n=1 Tax=Dichanthelium oligosanthes TaxID=888268 RepID=A0A1E5V1G8_9POAL|nr:putative carboxylesterase 2 [Dichanthelium oligosanthes]
MVMYFHGGGFMIGLAGSAAYHRCLNDLAMACPALAVSVDYRLAPEHPVPAAAGGNICLHLAMHRDIWGAGLKGVVLIHPWFWGREPIGREPRSTTRMQKGLWEFMCPGAVDGEDDPRMNPTAPGAPGLENLACEKVMVCVAEGDILRWRGKLYAEAAARARGGGDEARVELFESEGVGHMFYLLEPAVEKSKELLDRIAAFVSAE